MVFKNVLTIDPGLNTGLALFSDEYKSKPVVTEVLRSPNKAKTVEEKLTALRLLIKSAIRANRLENKLRKVIIEGVEVWGSSTVSMAAATKGGLSLLAYIVGMYYSIFSEYADVIFVSPREWKGQLTEDALREWVRRDTGIVYENEHILSAVGIGILTKGKLW